MPSISIYQEENNRYYQVYVDVYGGVLDKIDEAPSTAEDRKSVV